MVRPGPARLSPSSRSGASGAASLRRSADSHKGPLRSGHVAVSRPRRQAPADSESNPGSVRGCAPSSHRRSSFPAGRSCRRMTPNSGASLPGAVSGDQPRPQSSADPARRGRVRGPTCRLEAELRTLRSGPPGIRTRSGRSPRPAVRPSNDGHPQFRPPGRDPPPALLIPQASRHLGGLGEHPGREEAGRERRAFVPSGDSHPSGSGGRYRATSRRGPGKASGAIPHVEFLCQDQPPRLSDEGGTVSFSQAAKASFTRGTSICPTKLV